MYRIALSAAVLLLLLAGCGPRKTTTSIQGTVLSGSETPFAGARVLIEGRPLVTTDADGKFTITDVEPPYRIVVETDSNEFVAFAGVTTPNPTLRVGNASSAYHTTLEGELQNTVAGRKAGLSLASPAALGAKYADATGATLPYAINAALLTQPTSGRLYALEWAFNIDGNADAFTGYGSSANKLTLVNGASQSGLDIALDPVPATLDLEISASVPADYDVLATAAGVRLWPEEQLGLPLLTASFDSTTPLPVTVRAPDLPGARMVAVLIVSEPGGADAIGVTWASVPVTAASADLAVPARPALLGPADGATGVGAGSELTWTAPAGSLSLLLLNGDVDLIAYSSEPHFTLPDLSAFGTDYGSAAAYIWKAVSFRLEGFGDVDSMLTDHHVLPPLALMTAAIVGTPINASGYFVLSPERGFTTP